MCRHGAKHQAEYRCTKDVADDVADAQELDDPQQPEQTQQHQCLDVCAGYDAHEHQNNDGGRQDGQCVADQEDHAPPIAQARHREPQDEVDREDHKDHTLDQEHLHAVGGEQRGVFIHQEQEEDRRHNRDSDEHHVALPERGGRLGEFTLQIAEVLPPRSKRWLAS